MQNLRAIAVLAILIAICVFAAGCSGAISGSVMSATAGTPVKDAEVVVAGIKCKTGAKGKFILPEVDTGEQVVRITCNGFAPYSGKIEVTRKGLTLNVELQDGLVKGVVKEVAVEPELITSATVAIGKLQTTTDEEGHFKLAGVAVGEQPIVVKAENHEPLESTLTVAPGQNNAELELSLTPTATYMRYYEAYRFDHMRRAWLYVHPDVKRHMKYERFAKDMRSDGEILSFKIHGYRLLKKWRAPGIGKNYKNAVEIDRSIRYQSMYGAYTDNYSQHWVILNNKWFIVFDPRP